MTVLVISADNDQERHPMLYRPVNCGPLELRPAKETPLGGGLVALAVDTPDGAGVIDVGTLDRGEVELLRDACDEALQ